MFGIRTPTKNNPKSGKEKDERAGPSTKEEVTKVRRSIGEWEKGKPSAREKTATPETKSPSTPTDNTELAKKAGVTMRATKMAATATTRNDPDDQGPPKQAASYKSRTEEARACLNRAKQQLHLSRNIKTEIKQELMQALERLYQIVKESENKVEKDETPPAKSPAEMEARGAREEKLAKAIEDHAILIKENTAKMAAFSSNLDRLQEKADIQASNLEETYASVAARNKQRNSSTPPTLHSIVVTSKNLEETGEEVLQKIREAVKAKEGGIVVDRVRKAKDQKIVMGCKTKEEREKVANKIKNSGMELNVEEVRNKDPLVIFRDVLTYNTDEDITQALKNQNASLLEGMSEQEKEIIVRFRKKTRNPHVAHVIARVSPIMWRRLTMAGTVGVDLQRVRVEDHSPLIQCSQCLGYGHGKRHCREKVEACSHCGGAHLKTKCTEWAAGAEPSCINCSRAKIDDTGHNAFSEQCPVRRKWDTIARAAIAYC